MASQTTRVELRSVSKRYPGVSALDQVDLDVSGGEVLAVVGENGAGKSTLLKILGGAVAPDSGEIRIDGGRPTRFDVRASQAAGIRFIQQELSLAPDLSVAENIFLGHHPRRGPAWLGLLDARAMNEAASAALARLGAALDPRTPARRLGMAHRQLVEIARAVAVKGRTLIFDEPTSSLSSPETRRLLEVIEQLRRAGAAIIYVSHNLDEVLQIATRVIVLRDGRRVAALRRDEATRDRLTSLMIGRDLEAATSRRRPPVDSGPPVLEVRDLRLTGRSPAISLRIRAGEIVGLAGLVGAGRTELARAIVGADPHASGRILVGGKPVRIRSPYDAARAGVGLAPDDRKQLGVFAELSTSANLAAVTWARRAWRLDDREAERARAEQAIDDLQIHPRRPAHLAGRLSGGNQQKVVVGKWLAAEPKIMIFDEPTRGVDVGAKQEIYRIIVEAAARGMAVMVISNELEEILRIAHRALVMRRGEIVAEVQGDEMTEENLMVAALEPSSTLRAS